MGSEMCIRDRVYSDFMPSSVKVVQEQSKADLLYKYLKEQKGFGGFDPNHPLTPLLESGLYRTQPDFRNTPDIKWNFTKFLIDRDGNVVERFEPTTF